MPFESLFEPLSANITIAINALEQLNIDWHAIWKAIYEAAIKAASDEQIEYEAHNMEQQLTRLANTSNGVLKFVQFISNMRITPSKEEQTVLINYADEIQIRAKTLLDWFKIYQTEAEKQNAPLRQARFIRSQDANGPHANEQIMRIDQPPALLSVPSAVSQMLFPFKSKVQQYEKINNVKITQQTQIKDIKMKPLNKLQRPYFSQILGSWKFDLVFVVIPLIVGEKNATQILAALKKLINQEYVNNIRAQQSS
ncbi:MAG: hypothetical protein EZS28_018276 [Streblomastix strix]|uniref:Uncharacterized protein n=1 Tax=Streblomastix strix TaxID=222440 RepID=A0A5J4VUC0_9EUKA|nr:MAG: hypothetical protein EZS28_018276 [Streblomastix strix]